MAAARRFAGALAQTELQPAALPMTLHVAMRAGMASQLLDLQQEIATYERLRKDHISVIDGRSVSGIPLLDNGTPTGAS